MSGLVEAVARAPLLSSLREPPVVGRYYMVPVVWADDYCGVHGYLPVIGPAHTDNDHFNFPHRHYHVDARFLKTGESKKIASYMFRGTDVHFVVGAVPLSNYQRGGIPRGLPKLAKRRCTSNESPYRHEDKQAVKAMRAHYGEPDAITLGDGRKLCPHRKADLTQFSPDADGFVTCPLHGLRVRCLTSSLQGDGE